MPEKTCNCGRTTNEPDGVCVICKMNERLTDKGFLTLAELKEDEKVSKEKCEVEGCTHLRWKERRCMVHYNEKHGIVRQKPGPKDKAKVLPAAEVKLKNDPEQVKMKAGKISEPERTHPFLPSKEGIVENSPLERGAGVCKSKNACLGQLLYASDLLDTQINTAIEDGTVDTKTILDIRHRLGEVLRDSLI